MYRVSPLSEATAGPRHAPRRPQRPTRMASPSAVGPTPSHYRSHPIRPSGYISRSSPRILCAAAFHCRLILTVRFRSDGQQRRAQRTDREARMAAARPQIRSRLGFILVAPWICGESILVRRSYLRRLLLSSVESLLDGGSCVDVI